MASSVPDVGPEDDPDAEITPPDVSIVVPTYNRREQLLKTLAALDAGHSVTSTGKGFTFEVIVVSDGSTDGTVEAARSLGLSVPLSVLEQENGGPAAARNTGIEASRGELVVFIDDDVIPEPQCVAAHVERHLDHDDLVVIGPMLTPPSGLTPWVAWEQRQLEKQYARFAVDPTAYHRQFYTGNASVSRAALVAVGGFDTSYRRAEDVELAHRLHLAGMTFLFEQRARAYHHAERSFESWKRVGHDYGVNDVSFGRSGQPESLRLIGVFFRERHVTQRWFFRTVVPRRRFAGLVERVLDRCIRRADTANSNRATQQLLSAAYGLQYYGGVYDATGSRAQFLELLDGRSMGDEDADAHTFTAWFVLEQTLGHVTHSANLMHLIPRVDDVVPTFIPVDASFDGRAASFPGWSNWTVRAGVRARRGLRHHRQAAGYLPDALFVHSQVPAVLLGRWMRRIPTVVSLDATPLQYDELGAFYAHDTGHRGVEWIKRRANRRCFGKAKHLVTWSAWARQGLIDGYAVAPDKVTVIAPGVDVERWRRRTSRSTLSRPLRILFVGGDLDRKGGRLLLAATDRLRHRADVPDFEVNLVTPSNVDETDGVVVHRDLTPNSPALIEQYHRADIFCLPTLGDCLPMVLAEAGAAGLALVSTDVGAIGEIVRSGETGILIDAGDVDQLEMALHTLLTDHELRARCGQNAEALIRASHDASANAVRLIAVLTAAAG